MNQAGQAAVTDALFMLSIIAGLSVMLFVFSSTYGQDISAHILRQYSVDYTTDALKTLLYSSTPRIPGEQLNPNLPDAAKEVDYLLAVVKEDYADSLSLGADSKKVLRDNVEKIMRPVSDQFDYLFVILKPAPIEFVYVLLYRTEFECKVNGQPVSCEEGIRDLEITYPDPVAGPSHQFYFCSPNNPQAVASLVYAVGDSSQSNSHLLLLKSSERGGLGIDQAQASLIVWPATIISSQLMGVDGLNCSPAS